MTTQIIGIALLVATLLWSIRPAKHEIPTTRAHR